VEVVHGPLNADDIGTSAHIWTCFRN